jgi:ribosomal protein S18 acetylase RimI-like enzyme
MVRRVIDTAVKNRPSQTPDLGFLEAMLFEAVFWDSATIRPSFVSFRAEPEFGRLLEGWGRSGDRALIADNGRERVGAAWFRLWTDEVHSYGFVSADIPELGIAVSAGYRFRGVGRELPAAIIEVAAADGFPGLSLSVSPENPARVLYERFGFRKVGECGTSWTMLRRFASGKAQAGAPQDR